MRVKLYKHIEQYIKSTDKYGIMRGALVIFAFTGLLVFGAVRLSYMQTKSVAVDTLLESASQGAAKVSSEMRLAADRVKAAAKVVSNFDDISDKRMLGVLESVENDAMFSHFALRTENGTSIQSDGRRISSVVWSSETAAHPADSSVTVSARTVSAQDGGDILRIFAPVEGKLAEENALWLYGVIEVGTLESSFASTGFGGNSSLVVFEKNSGHVLMDTDDWLDLGGADIGGLSKLRYAQGFSANKVFSDIVDSQKGYTEIVTDNGNIMCAYLPAGVSDWYVLQLVPKEVLFESYDKGKNPVILSYLIVIAAMVIFIFWINGRVARVKKNDENSKYHTEMNTQVLATALTDTSIRIFLYYKNTGEALILKDGAGQGESKLVKNGLDTIAANECLSEDDARRLKNSAALVGPGKNVKFTLCSHRGGTESFLRYTLVGSKDANGDPTLVIGTARDITADETERRKKLDVEKFRNSVVTYKTSGFEIYLERNGWKIMWLNEPLLSETLGKAGEYDKDLKRAVLPLIHPSDRENVGMFLDRLTLLEDFRRGRTEKSMEYRIMCDTKDGGVYEYRIIEVRLLRELTTDQAKADIYIRNVENADLERFTVKQIDEITNLILSSVMCCLSNRCTRAAYARLEDNIFVPVTFDGRSVLPRLEKFEIEAFMENFANKCVAEEDRARLVEMSKRSFIKKEISEKGEAVINFKALVERDGKSGYVPVTRHITPCGEGEINEVVIIEKTAE